MKTEKVNENGKHDRDRAQDGAVNPEGAEQWEVGTEW